jgi:hypothetical protein
MYILKSCGVAMRALYIAFCVAMAGLMPYQALSDQVQPPVSEADEATLPSSREVDLSDGVPEGDPLDVARRALEREFLDAGLSPRDARERTRLLLEVARLEEENRRIGVEFQRLSTELERLRQERERLVGEIRRHSASGQRQSSGWLGVMIRDTEIMRRDLARMDRDLRGLIVASDGLIRAARINRNIALAGVGDSGVIESVLRALQGCCNKPPASG